MDLGTTEPRVSNFNAVDFFVPLNIPYLNNFVINSNYIRRTSVEVPALSVPETEMANSVDKVHCDGGSVVLIKPSTIINFYYYK